MNLEQVKIGFRDLISVGGLIVTIMISYYSLRSEIRDGFENNKILEIRIKVIEAKAEKLELEIERLKYDNLDNNVYQTPTKKRRAN